MGKKYLFSPIGNTDPIKYLYDGSMIHIAYPPACGAVQREWRRGGDRRRSGSPGGDRHRGLGARKGFHSARRAGRRRGGTAEKSARRRADDDSARSI